MPTSRDAKARRWDGSGLSWSAGETVAVRLVDPGPSADATLSGLALEHGRANPVTLSPAFESAATSYTGSVGSVVDEITIEAEVNDPSATYAILDANDRLLVDANLRAGGFQVALDVGENTIKVKVRAEDGTATGTYTVAVTRAATTSIRIGPALVSNTGKSAHSTSPSVGVGNTSNRHVQGFRTGSDPAGYPVTAVGVYVEDEDLEAGETMTVAIYTLSSSGQLGTLVDTLTSPASYIDDAVNEFTASPGVTLSASTDYAVAFQGTGDEAADFKVYQTLANAEDAGKAPEWSIEDARRFDSNFHNSLAAFMISVNGVRTMPLDDATLSGLTLVDLNGNPVTLTPTFASNVDSYSASVASAVGGVTIEATTNDRSATVAYLGGDDRVLTDADARNEGFQVGLALGENVVKVKVTADDGVTTETYTLAVTRAASTPLPTFALVSNTGQPLSSTPRFWVGDNARHTQRFTTGDSGPDSCWSRSGCMSPTRTSKPARR